MDWCRVARRRATGRYGKRDRTGWSWRSLRASRSAQGVKAKLTGRALGLLGPNGAGKTTLVHTLLGFYKPWQGTARIFGHDIRTEGRKIRSMIGYMPESDSFVTGMTAIRLTRMLGELSGLPPEVALERSHEALHFVGLNEARYRKIETYSLGMKQMAKLAQAMVHGPRLLFLDEPTNGLDPPHRRRMIDLIKEVRDSHNMNIVLSSHLLRDVEECCDEVLILKGGHVAHHCDLERERKANRKFIMVETGEDCTPLVEALDAMGCEHHRVSERRLKMVLPEGFAIRKLYEIASERNLQLRRLDYKRDSLQDIFLKAMEESGGSLRA